MVSELASVAVINTSKVCRVFECRVLHRLGYLNAKFPVDGAPGRCKWYSHAGSMWLGAGYEIRWPGLTSSALCSTLASADVSSVSSDHPCLMAMMHSFLIFFYPYMHWCFACRHVCVMMLDLLEL